VVDTCDDSGDEDEDDMKCMCHDCDLITATTTTTTYFYYFYYYYCVFCITDHHFVFINRHVLDERRLLAYMDSPFVMKLYGTYQTPHTLVMVSEPLNCGDLWSIIYETPPFSENNGLPFDLAAFYATCLVWGLSHIHEKGVVYRDLKPENIMLDDKGYIRIIDFGFSKRVPYTKKDSVGVVKVLAKTYTLCGTPGMKLHHHHLIPSSSILS
jgi:cGMP-dependent protein kinase